MLRFAIPSSEGGGKLLGHVRATCSAGAIWLAIKRFPQQMRQDGSFPRLTTEFVRER